MIITSMERLKLRGTHCVLTIKVHNKVDKAVLMPIVRLQGATLLECSHFVQNFRNVTSVRAELVNFAIGNVDNFL